MSVFMYQRKMFQGHILWEKSGNKKYHSYVAWRLQGPLDNVKNNQNQNVLVYVTVMILKRILWFLRDPTHDFSVLGPGNTAGLQWRIYIWWPSSPVASHTVSLFWKIIRHKLCYMLTALPSSRIQKIMSYFILHGKAISERKCDNNNSPTNALNICSVVSSLWGLQQCHGSVPPPEPLYLSLGMRGISNI